MDRMVKDMVIRAKRKELFQGKALTAAQQENSQRNLKEIEEGTTVLTSFPRRLVFELTNACNLNCVMCGRNAADFKSTMFDMDVFRGFEPLFDTIEEVTLMGWGEPTIHPGFNEMLSIIDKHSARKYFCTNGMNLKKIKSALLDYKVDVFAVSVDGASYETNARIRRGSDLNVITADLKEIVAEKKRLGVPYPWINFVFCAMDSNIEELPDLIRLASEIGIEEVKVVYLTVFEENLLHESLWGKEGRVREIFAKSMELGEQLGILLKLPHIAGEDIAGGKYHKDCFVPWRDFFLGSDGYVRGCMSTSEKLFPVSQYDTFEEMWNSKEYQNFRKTVNTENMSIPCRNCYQASFANWNKRDSFIQVGNKFSPDWEKTERN